MKDGFIKVAAASPQVRVADCAYNAAEIIRCANHAAKQGVKLLVTPELGITGYTCGDLFGQTRLLEGALDALKLIANATVSLDMLLVVGLPLRHKGKLYNCAAVLLCGRVLGIIPKTNLPNYGEFYEQRNFAAAPRGIDAFEQGFLLGTPFSTQLLFRCENMHSFVLACEICEDLWVPSPPSQLHSIAGATVIANLSASNETVGKAEYRRSLVCGHSSRMVCGYVYAGSGGGESTTDLVFAGHNIIAENGHLLAQTQLFSQEMAVSEIDTERLHHQRATLNTFPSAIQEEYLVIPFALAYNETTLTRYISPSPFVPSGEEKLTHRCETIFAIQSAGLQKRLLHTGAARAVIGVSGGLDSTLALLITEHAFHAIGLPPSNIMAVTMPCFGTTGRTRTNAEKLCGALGIALETIPIDASVQQHFKDIKHSETDFNVVYENAQARMRTLVLMDLANKHNGLVIGTGDLSELALGWATYGGDHISMYGVNASVPKTLLKYLVAYIAKTRPELSEVLEDILNTPVSPELLPAIDGEISQKTEHLVGPYELHDFFLYYTIKWGFTPRKVFRLAQNAFGTKYPLHELLQWMQVFYTRFFSQQFKRSCLPDGPKVGSVSLSPRGDWRMPSDASAALWLGEVQALIKEMG